LAEVGELQSGSVRTVTREDRESVARYGLKEMVLIFTSEKQSGFADIPNFCDEHLKFITNSYEHTLSHILGE